MFKKIASYTVGLYLTTIFASLVRLGLKSLIAKTIGKEAFGVYGYFSSAITVGVSLLGLGLARALAKHVASSSKQGKAYGHIVSTSLVIIAALSALLVGAAFALRGSIEEVWFYILIGVGPATVLHVAQATFRGQFERNLELITNLLSALVQGVVVALFIFLVHTQLSPVIGLASANILIMVLIFGYFIITQRKSWSFSVVRSALVSGEYRDVMGLAMPLWFASVVGVLSTQADVFIVEGQLGFEVLAEYAAAFTFVGLLNLPTKVLSRMFLVTFASGYYTDFEKYKRVASVNMAFITTIGLVVTVLAIPLTPIVFTDEYTRAPLLAAILSVAFVFKAVELLNSALTIAMDFPKANLYSKLWTLVVYLPLAFFLVRSLGVYGAAISNVFSWGGYALIHAWYMRKDYRQYAQHTFFLTIIGTILYSLTIALAYWISTYWIVLVALPLYLGLGHLFRLWDLTTFPGLVYRLLPEKITERLPFSFNREQN
jgi:O-antigen/teichoic acid export membrane protein